MQSSQKLIIIIGALLIWFAVVAQYVIMIESGATAVPEATVRFFSYFTILSNSLIGVYFTFMIFGKYTALGKWFQQAGIITALCMYITVVGLVYQLVLRPLWVPEGMQRVVDELLHSVNPLYFLIYWILFEDKSKLQWSFIPKWLIYPLVYVFFILVRGSFSNFYPYPFVNVAELGMQQVIINSLFLFIVFVGLSALYIGIGKAIAGRRGN